MKLSTNMVLQAIALAAQGFNQFGALMPDSYKAAFTLGISILQLIAGYIGHVSNPTTGTLIPPVEK